MKFVDFLNEAAGAQFDGVIIKGYRSTKLNKKGETSNGYVLNPEDKKLVAYIFKYYSSRRIFVALKTEKIDPTQLIAFVKVDKPTISAFTNIKIDSDGDTGQFKYVNTVTMEELLKTFNQSGDRLVISEKADAYLKTTIEESDEETEEEELFAIGYWSNPYRANDREYFWFGNNYGEFENKKQILAAAQRKCKNGQPTRFRDYMSGTAKAFTNRKSFLAAAEKVGLKPNLKDY